MMNVVVPTHEEIAWRQCLDILQQNPLTISAYYTTLFTTFKSLLTVEHIEMLNDQVKEFEIWISDELNKMTLHEVELRMYNNFDLLSGFDVKGKLITQMEIQEKLDEIKIWLTELLYLYLPHIRFTQPIKII